MSAVGVIAVIVAICVGSVADGWLLVLFVCSVADFCFLAWPLKGVIVGWLSLR